MSDVGFTLLLIAILALAFTIGYRAKGLNEKWEAEETKYEQTVSPPTTIPLRGW